MTHPPTDTAGLVEELNALNTGSASHPVGTVEWCAHVCAAMEDCVAALTSKDEEIERLTTHSLDVQMRLQAICETLGCPPGLNRLRFLEAVASKLQASEALSERLRGALEEGENGLHHAKHYLLSPESYSDGERDHTFDLIEQGLGSVRAALSLPLETEGNIVSRDQSPTTCAASVASDLTGQQRGGAEQ